MSSISKLSLKIVARMEARKAARKASRDHVPMIMSRNSEVVYPKTTITGSKLNYMMTSAEITEAVTAKANDQKSNGLDLRQGDCRELIKTIPSGSVDLILVDPPYGVTDAEWDKHLDWTNLWHEIKRVLKPAGVACICSVQPFTSQLITSLPGAKKNYYRHSWYWQKKKPTGHLLARTQPLRALEEICIFGTNSRSMTFNPQKVLLNEPRWDTARATRVSNLYKIDAWTRAANHNGGNDILPEKLVTHAHPTNILYFPNVTKQRVPTQKPIELMEYLIKTYTNPGDTVLDFCMGSGTTGVASRNLDRKFIGFEKEKKHFLIAKDRIKSANDNR